MNPLRRLLPHLRRERGAYAGGLAILVLAAACGAAAPRIAGQAVDRIRLGTTRDDVFWSAAALLGVAVLRAILIFVSRYVVLAAARRIEYGMRNDVFAHLESLSGPYYDRNATGDITSRAINDLENVRMMIGIGVISLVSTGLMTVASLAMMADRSLPLAALIAVPLLGISAVMAWTGSKMHDLSLSVQEQLGVLSSRAQENFSGARVVRAFVQEAAEIARYRAGGAEYRDRNMRLARWRAASWAGILVLAEGGLALTLWAGGGAVIGGSLTPGVLTEFTIYQFQLLWPMIAIGWVVNLIQRGVVCMKRLLEVLDARPEVDDARAVPLDRPLEGRIEARGLTFAYAPDRPPALKDVTFTIERGMKGAIVGRTGSGKSTLVQLLLRHYPAGEGMLFVDGRDVNAIRKADLRGAIGVVPQDLFLFSDTLRENVRFGGSDGTSDEAVDRAAELSRLSADLDQFPGRLDQLIGERGVTLSGGQRQRTALARAVVREPAILILDDALSSVDSHTEREIRDRLYDFARGRTTIVITHRLSAVVDADLILVLEDGRLVEQGRHASLAAAGGAYARLWDSQRLEEELSTS